VNVSDRRDTAIIKRRLKRLAIRARRGDNHAAAQLWTETAPRLLAVARQLLGPAEAGGEDVDDAVQNAFLAMITCENTAFKRIDDLHAWLIVTTRNEAKMMIRSTARRRARNAAHAMRNPAQGESLRVIEESRNLSVAAAMQYLPDEYRESLILRHIGRLTFEQLGKACGISKSGAAQRYNAAVQAVSKHIDPSSLSMESQVGTQFHTGEPPKPSQQASAQSFNAGPSHERTIPLTGRPSHA
jgi:RNA polymerase sigma factor (sigma-70 family)